MTVTERHRGHNAALRWLWPPSSPELRHIPLAVVRAALFGAVVGPWIGALVLWLRHTPQPQSTLLSMSGMLHASAVGATYAVSFYVTTALPVGYVSRSTGDTRRHSRWLILLTALAGGWLGNALAALAIASPAAPSQAVRLMVVTAVASLVLALLRTRRDQLRAEIALGQARAHASALQAQINPHFFFNALNTIAALIAIDPPAAQQVVDRLGEVSRRTLAAPTRDFVDLADELDLTRAYLDIEVARFSDRLRVDLPAASPVAGLQIPPLTLQPLVDNAIRHGIAARPDGGHLVVHVDRSTRGWTLVVENDVDPATLSTGDFFRAGHALANIRDRLALVYGTRAAIRVTRPRPDAIRVEVDVPDCP
jgi:hypothetical protein